MKTTLTIQTTAGTFTRTTASKYTHIVVYASPRAKKVFDANEKTQSGVDARWIKDRGFGVTWHGSLASAEKAAKAGYKWDSEATLVGVFSI